jgi:pyruvate,water dikinase
MEKYKHILFFNQIGIEAIGKVGGKNASLGERYNQLNLKGINILNSFTVTAGGYRFFNDCMTWKFLFPKLYILKELQFFKE